MLNNSELVFEGTAINVETIRGENIHQTKTEVEFEILDIIKGEYAQPTIKLRFAGGTVDGQTLKISGLHYPDLGETGIYFVETLSQNLVHPLYGWSQGHFKISSEDTVTTRSETSIIDIVESRETEFRGTVTDGDGVAQGVILMKSRTGEPGMPRTRFKQKLRDMLE